MTTPPCAAADPFEVVLVFLSRTGLDGGKDSHGTVKLLILGENRSYF
jgi:hypothetical protein